MGRRKNNSLNDRHVAALYSWLDREREWCAEATAKQCAVRAADQLGFAVTASNILTAKRSLGITKPKPSPTVGGCQCAEFCRAGLLAAVILHWINGAATEADFAEYRRELRRIIDNKPATVALELPLGATSPLRFEVAG